MAEQATAVAPTDAKAPAADPKAVAVDAKAAEAEPTQEFIVNGKPVKLTAAQVKVAVQKGLFADQKLKSVDAMQKGTQGIVEALKTPEGVLKLLQEKSLGNSPKAVLKAILSSSLIDDEAKEDLSRWVYDNVVVQSKKTPEQIENDKKLSDYERLKKDDEDRKAKDSTAKQQAEVQQVYQAVRAEVTKQILADKTFPQTEGSVRAVVEKLRVMNRQGATITPENITKALGFVKKDHILHQQTMLDAIEDPESLIALLGEARALKISKALVARIQAKNKVKAAEVKPQENGVREKLTDRIDKKLGRTSQGYSVLEY